MVDLEFLKGGFQYQLVEWDKDSEFYLKKKVVTSTSMRIKSLTKKGQLTVIIRWRVISLLVTKTAQTNLRMICKTNKCI